MTVCGHSYSGLCGACEHLQVCRNSELAKVPMTNEEWFTSLSTEEKAWFLTKACAGRLEACERISFWVEWLKEKHE